MEGREGGGTSVLCLIFTALSEEHRYFELLFGSLANIPTHVLEALLLRHFHWVGPCPLGLKLWVGHQGSVPFAMTHHRRWHS